MLENGAGVNSVPQYRALRNDRFLYVRHDTTGEYELYDLRKDPYELANLEDIDAYAGVKRALSRRLRALQRCAGAACFTPPPSVRLSCASSSAREPRAPRTAARAAWPAACACRSRGGTGGGWSRCATPSGGGAWGRLACAPFRVDVARRRLPAGRSVPCGAGSPRATAA